MMQDVFVGVDVAKDWLDVHHVLSGARRIANTVAAARSFAAACAKQGAWVIFEASGGYDRVLRDALETCKLANRDSRYLLNLLREQNKQNQRDEQDEQAEARNKTGLIWFRDLLFSFSLGWR